MKIRKVTKKLERELSKRNFHLVWKPEPADLGSDGLIVFGAEETLKEGEKPLITGIGPVGLGEQFGNSPVSVIQDRLNKFLEALAAAGIPQRSLHSSYPYTGRGKIWPTFVARFTQEAFKAL